MNRLQPIHFPLFLLFSSVFYTFFKPNPYTAFILIPIAALFAYERYIQSQKLPSIQKALDEMKMEFQKQLEEQRNEYKARLTVLEDELAKQAIAKANSSSSSKTTGSKPKTVMF